MTEVLSQDEIDQLLTVISAGDCEGEETAQSRARKNIKIYDFKRPDILTKKEIKTVNNFFVKFASYLQDELENTKICCSSVFPLTYEEFSRALPHNPILYKNNHHELKYILFNKDNKLEKITPELVFKVLHEIIGFVDDTYTDYRKDYLFYEDKHEMVCTFTIEVVKGELEGLVDIAIPCRELKAWIHKDDKIEESNMQFNIGDIQTTVEASLGKAKWSVSDLELLEEGTIIELDRNVGDAIPVFVDGKQIGIGEVVLVDEKFGVRVTEVFK